MQYLRGSQGVFVNTKFNLKLTCHTNTNDLYIYIYK